jgi:xanthine/uracil/vitamin C permease (AzgA family)
LEILQGNISYESAVTAVAIEGAIFFVLSLTGLRYKIIRLIPEVSSHRFSFVAVFFSAALTI